MIVYHMNKNLLLRIFSAMAAVPMVLLIVWAGGFLYDLLITLAMLGAFSEWIGMTNADVRKRVRWIGFAGLAAILFSVPVFGLGFAFQLSLVVWLAVLLSAGRHADEKTGDDKAKHRSNALWLSAGIPYLAWSGMALLSLRAGEPQGFTYVVFLLLTVWATDTGGYLFGKIIGGPKLWPQISPNKTWAGLIGAMHLAGFTGYAVAAYFGGIHPVLGAGLAVALAAVAQAGDLFESYVKRRNGIKDSGTLIPGHGGMLDRIDGLLFAALLMFAVVRL